MPGINELNGLIKKSAIEAVKASKPSGVYYGEVKSVSPLTVQVSQNFIIDQDFLILSRSVTDYEVDITLNHTTEDYSHTHTIIDTYTGSGSASTDTHNHEITGIKTMTIHQALKVGEKVLLIRRQGGQKYVIIDRVVGL